MNQRLTGIRDREASGLAKEIIEPSNLLLSPAASR